MLISSIFYLKGKKKSPEKLAEESAFGMHVLYEYFCQQNERRSTKFQRRFKYIFQSD